MSSFHALLEKQCCDYGRSFAALRWSSCPCTHQEADTTCLRPLAMYFQNRSAASPPPGVPGLLVQGSHTNLCLVLWDSRPSGKGFPVFPPAYGFFFNFEEYLRVKNCSNKSFAHDRMFTWGPRPGELRAGQGVPVPAYPWTLYQVPEAATSPWRLHDGVLSDPFGQEIEATRDATYFVILCGFLPALAVLGHIWLLACCCCHPALGCCEFLHLVLFCDACLSIPIFLIFITVYHLSDVYYTFSGSTTTWIWVPMTDVTQGPWAAAGAGGSATAMAAAVPPALGFSATALVASVAVAAIAVAAMAAAARARRPRGGAAAPLLGSEGISGAEGHL